MSKFRFGGPTRYPYQVRALKRIVAERGVLALLADPGMGKGHPLDEPVLTPSGWVPVGELSVGDQVIGSNGLPTEVTGVFDRGVLPTYLVEFHDGSSIRVDGDHLWALDYQSKGTKRRTVRDTSWLLSHKNIKAFEVPRVSVKGSDADLPVDPYLLGSLIADAHLSPRGVTWTKNDPGVIAEFLDSCARQGVEAVERHADYLTVRRFGVRGMLPVLRSLGLLVNTEEKRIPDVYFHCSREDRVALLAGLFDGDGSVRLTRGTARFASVSKVLAEGVQRLLWSLGEAATLTWVNHSKRGYWYVQVRSQFNPFWGHPQRHLVTGPSRNSRRSFKSITRVEDAPIRCISVAAEDSLYVAKDYIVTHNTAISLDYCSLLALKATSGEARVLVIAPKEATDTWVLQSEKWVSPDVSVWAEVLGGSRLHKAAALAARGEKPFRRLPKDDPSLLKVKSGYEPRAHLASRALTRFSRPEVPEQAGPSALPEPRLVLEVIGMDTLSTSAVYGSRKEADLILDAVKRFDPDLVICDELHMAKGWSSNTSRLLGKIGSVVQRRLGLTGTVMPHSPLDVVAQWRFIDPYAFGKVDRFGERLKATQVMFKERFAVMGGFMGKQVVSWTNLDDMKQIMSRNALVLSKEDELDLPAVQDVELPVHLSPRESRAYATMRKELAALIDPHAEIGAAVSTATSQLVKQLRLRQITAGHLKDDNGQVVTIGTSKAQAVATLVNVTLAGEKRVVVFGVFKHELSALAEACAIKGTEVLLIDGSTPDHVRMEHRARFGSDDPTRLVIVAQIRTLSMSVNELVTAAHAVFTSLPNRRDQYVQARDRLNRLGQTRKVTFWHAVAPGTVDEVILESHRQAGDLEKAMLDHIQGSY